MRKKIGQKTFFLISLINIFLVRSSSSVAANISDIVTFRLDKSSKEIEYESDFSNFKSVAFPEPSLLMWRGGNSWDGRLRDMIMWSLQTTTEKSYSHRRSRPRTQILSPLYIIIKDLRHG